ncbi:MAG: hypothetical protein JNJ60_10295, partial [Rhodocyclaceae bacterium]|nr:hypothetical protein [Rhodocyclaceae bacterium]
SPGISASGGIFLTALGSNVTDSITLNGPLSSSGGNISLVAGSSIQQNSSVTALAAAHILARANNGDIVLDPLAEVSVASGGSISYEAPLGHVRADLAQFFGAVPIFVQVGDVPAVELVQDATNDVVVLLVLSDQSLQALESLLDPGSGPGAANDPQQRRIGQCVR